jgi:hypothetical protein
MARDSRQRELDAARAEIREKGLAGFLSGRLPSEHLNKLVNDKDWLAQAGLVGAVAGINDSLSPADQARALAGAVRGSGLRSRLDGYTQYSDAEFGMGSHHENTGPALELGRVDINGSRAGSAQSDVVYYGARVLDHGSALTERTVELLGGKTNAEIVAFGVQAAVGGVPRTIASYAIDFVTGPAREKVGEALGGLIAEHGFDSAGADPQRLADINAVSRALGGFGVDLILGNARQVVEGGLNVRSLHNMRSYGGVHDRYVKELGFPEGTVIRNTPSAERNRQLFGEARHPVTGELGYIDPASQKWTKALDSDPLTRDHILSQRDIVDLSKQYGANAKQFEHLMTMDDNFQLLPRSINSSKGDSMGLKWESYPGSDGMRVSIPLEQQRALQFRQDAVRANMEAWLRSQGLTRRGG